MSVSASPTRPPSCTRSTSRVCSTRSTIAFNVITSQRKADAQNYGFDELMEHGQRYDRMDEFMDVCQALWRSVEPDAFEWDRATGRVANPDKVRPINHVGTFFKVKGP